MNIFSNSDQFCRVELTKGAKMQQLRSYLVQLRPVLYTVMGVSLPIAVLGVAGQFNYKHVSVSY
jgi:hypothetical protein